MLLCGELVCGKGSEAVLALLMEAVLGMRLVPGDVSSRVLQRFLLDERKRFVATARRLAKSGAIPVTPECLRLNSRGGHARIPETFPDFLCESRKVLEQLADVGKKKLRPAAQPDSGWAPESSRARAGGA